jgi:UDP-N-acetylmuramoyl-tripeptide--D-alanyl-D-alanine ligase
LKNKLLAIRGVAKGNKEFSMGVVHDPQRLALDALGTWCNVPLRPIRGFSIDSRTVKGGEMFIALETERDDGHRHLVDAMANGAVAAMVKHYQPQVPLAQLLVKNTIQSLQLAATAHRRRFPNPVIAIGGSYGKTTTKELLALLLGRDRVFATVANENNTLGVPLNLLQLDASQHAAAIVEVGINQRGEMDVIASILQPQYVLFTSFSKKHGEFFPSTEALFLEKTAIAKYIAPQNGCLFTSPNVARNWPTHNFPLYTIARHWNRSRPWITYESFGNGKQMECIIRFPGKNIAKEKYILPVPSEGFAYDFALSRAMAHHFFIPREAIGERLALWKPLSLRGQTFRHQWKEQIYFVDCYNSDAPALVESLQIFHRTFPHGRRHHILGSMSEYGKESARQHRWAGERIPIFPEDRYYVFCKEAIPMEWTLLRRGIKREHLQHVDTWEQLQHIVENLRGVIYFKGSRMHALERLIDFSHCDPFP